MNSNYVWIDKISDLLHIYNNRLDRTINMKPIDVKKEHESHLLKSAYNYGEKNVEKTKFKLNDHVESASTKYYLRKDIRQIGALRYLR